MQVRVILAAVVSSIESVALLSTKPIIDSENARTPSGILLSALSKAGAFGEEIGDKIGSWGVKQRAEISGNRVRRSVSQGEEEANASA